MKIFFFLFIKYTKICQISCNQLYPYPIIFLALKGVHKYIAEEALRNCTTQRLRNAKIFYHPLVGCMAI